MSRRSFVPHEVDPDDQCRWWTVSDGAGNRILADRIEPRLGERDSPGDRFVTYSNSEVEQR